MRKDMPKLSHVRGLDVMSRKRKLPTRGNLPLNEEALAPRQSLRASTDHSSYLHVRKLGPVRAWLRQQTGRPWDAVYSELCATFDKRNAAQAYALERTLAQVEMHQLFFAEDGQVCVVSSWGGSYPVCGLYVHPQTRLLCHQQLEFLSAARRRARNAANDNATEVKVTPTLRLRLVDGQWYWVELAPVTAPKTRFLPGYQVSEAYAVPDRYVVVHDSVCRDVLTGEQFYGETLSAHDRWTLERQYGLPDHYAVRKRQASHKDLRRYLPQQQLAA